MTQPLAWMRAVRDAKPTASNLLVLWAIGLRMRADGTGFASTGQLAGDTSVTERTVKRATRWGRDQLYLLQTRRGHRLGNGGVVASEWRLITPVADDSQGDTGVPLRTSQGDTTPVSRGQEATLKGTPETPPEVFSQRSSSSSHARARAQVNGTAVPAGQNDDEDLDNQDQKNDVALTRYLFELLTETAPLDEVGNPDLPFYHINGPPEVDVETAGIVIDRIRRDYHPPKIRGYLRKMAETGDLLEHWNRAEEEILDERRRQRKAERALELDAAPDCHHGTPHGTGPNIVTGFRQCPLCRAEENGSVAS